MDKKLIVKTVLKILLTSLIYGIASGLTQRIWR